MSSEISGALKEEVRDSFAATTPRFDVEEVSIEQWITTRLDVAVSIKRLNSLMFWIRPTLDIEFQRLLQSRKNFNDAPFRLMDRWAEVLGLNLRPSWIRMIGIPLHAWIEKVLQCLGDCIVQVMQLDDNAISEGESTLLKCKCLGISRIAFLQW